MIKRILFITALFVSLNSFAMSEENQKNQDSLLMSFCKRERYYTQSISEFLCYINTKHHPSDIPLDEMPGTPWLKKELIEIYHKHNGDRNAITQELIDLGAHVNYDGFEGTALHGAAKLGRLTVAETCIAHGANITKLNINSESPFSLALRHSPNSGIPELLIKHGALLKENSKKELDQDKVQQMLLDAIEGDSLRFVQTALDLGAQVNHTTSESVLFNYDFAPVKYVDSPFKKILQKIAYTTNREQRLPIFTELVQQGADTTLLATWKPHFLHEKEYEAFKPRLEYVVKELEEEKATYTYMQKLFEAAH